MLTVVVTGQVVKVVETLYQSDISLRADITSKAEVDCLHLGCGCKNNWN